MPILGNESMKMAAQLVQAGLEGGSLKLLGAGAYGSKETAKDAAEADLIYLETLIKGVAKVLSS